MNTTHSRAYFLAIVTTLLAILTIVMLSPFLVTIGLAAVFAVVFKPLHNAVQKTRLPASIVTLVTILIGIICVAVPLTFLSIQLVNEAQDVYVSVSQPGNIQKLQSTLSSFGSSLDRKIPGAGTTFQTASANLGTYTHTALGWSLAHVGTIFSSTLSFLLQFFIFLVTLYYFLKEGKRLTGAVEHFSPLAPAETKTLTARLTRTIDSVVRGSLLIAIIQGALTAVGFLIFGIPNAVLWGTVAIIGALIPSVGTALVFIPGVLYLFFTGHTGAAIGLIVYAVCFVGIVDNILRPYLVGGRASIHPLLILLSVLGGLALFGPAGLFLGPLVISLLLGLLSLYASAKDGSKASSPAA